ncbi:MAG: ABC transporter ATP-binding protein [Spirochaetia bacterium]
MNPEFVPLVACFEVSKSYADGDQAVVAISELSMEARAGQMTAVVGPSGSGKTTLLHLIGGIEHADSGSIIAAGADLGELSSSEQTAFRAQNVSFVFADMNLLPVLSVYENISLGLALLRLSARDVDRRAMSALDLVGLADRAHRLPATLSSGERQRVAVARALARESTLVIADEPTAHLDHDLALQITNLFRSLAGDHGSCVLMATHDRAVAEEADQILLLEDGRRID